MYKSLIVALFPLVFFLSDNDLTYKNIANGELKILVPNNLSKKPIPAIKAESIYDPVISDLYSNKDSSVSISIALVPKAQLKDYGHIVDIMFLAQATKIYSSEIITINNNQVYVIKCDLGGLEKGGYDVVFIINTKTKSVYGTIFCDKKLKEEWLPVSEKILNSLTLN